MNNEKGDFIINDMWAYCAKHPMKKYQYKKFDHCYFCQLEMERGIERKERDEK